MKKYILLFIVLCCISCNNSPKCYYVVKQDGGVFYKNYVSPKILPFSTSVLSQKYEGNIFEADRIRYKVDLKTKNQSVYHFVLNEYISSAEEYYKELKQNEYMGIDVDTTLQDVKLFFCGKLTFKPKIESFVFLKQTINNWNRFRTNKSLLLYNVKDKKLCSIISLSEKVVGIESITDIKSCNFGFNDFSRISDGLDSAYLPEDILFKLKKNEKDSQVISVSNFTINEAGMIKFN